ncbi:MAG: hypothetical protein FJX76_17640 [Armatimonadetes bacterium]|nr:hypothetical protein [Armatimonadota bacterium]
MMIGPVTFTPANTKNGALMKAVAQSNKPQAEGGASAVLSVASLVTTPVGLYAVGKAAFGRGEAGNVVKGLAGAGAAIGLYRGIKAVATSQTPAQINDALKEANGGRDLDPADAEKLAKSVNSRSHLGGIIGVGNSALTGAAIVTGNMALGLVALAVKFADIGYGVYSTAQTLKDFNEVLRNQPAPTPPAPTPLAPTP